MKILFICGSVQHGKDGVGDYTGRLCGELNRKGCITEILSLRDNHVNTFINEDQEVEGTKIVLHRIPASSSNNQRGIWSQDVLNNFKPDWVSLQFVPYSFNKKGLPFLLPSFLKKLKGNHNWHIMFHELWLGIDIESSFKHKCIGKLQQLIIKRTIYNIKPRIINTQNKLYQILLQNQDVMSHVLPIFGNIPLTAVKNEANVFTQFVLFGTIHHGAPFNDFVHDLLTIKNQFSKPIKFVFIGKNGPEISIYTDNLKKHNVYYEVLGIQSENVISQVLIDSDYGISTTPYYQTEKSGVYAAYKEHRVNTICVSRNWTPTKGQYNIPYIIKYEKNNLNLDTFDVKVFDLRQIANQFMNSISLL